MKFANLIIPYNENNSTGFRFVADNLTSKLKEAGLIKKHLRKGTLEEEQIISQDIGIPIEGFEDFLVIPEFKDN